MQAGKHGPSSAQAPHALWCGTQVSLHLCKASTGLVRSPRLCLAAGLGHCGQGARAVLVGLHPNAPPQAGAAQRGSLSEPVLLLKGLQGG